MNFDKNSGIYVFFAVSFPFMQSSFVRKTSGSETLKSDQGMAVEEFIV